MHDRPSPRKAVAGESAGNAVPLAALLLANVALAFGPWFVRMADVGPVAAAFWRIALAAPLLMALAATTGGRPLASARGLWGVLAISGLAFAGDLAAWHVGIRETTLANATLFGNSATFLLPLYGFAAAQLWPTRMQGTALLLAAAGAGLLLGRSYSLDPDHLVGDLMCVLAGALYAFYLVVMTRVRAVMAPLPALGWSTVFAALPLLLSAAMLGEGVWPGAWTPLVLLALMSQVLGQGLMIYALGRLPPLMVGLALLTQPVVAGAIGWIVYGERLGTLDFVGAFLVAVALVLVRRS